MKRSLFTASLFGAVAAASMGACSSPDLTGPCPIPPNATPQDIINAKEACYGGMGQTTVDTRPHKDVDILFLIDNSPSMSPKQKVLAQAIPGFISKIDATGANYHVGIATSDLGFNVPNGTTTGIPFPGQVLQNCNTAAGDDGKLQNIPCTSRTSLVGEAASACSTLCPDPRFVPNNNGYYIQKQDGITNVPMMMSGNMDIGPQLAFQCMALVGDVGCGIEQQIESVKRALDGHRVENMGFNRGTSVLAVIFITDEDDCSVALANRKLLNPATPLEGQSSCTTANGMADPACFNVDYRCIASDLACTDTKTGVSAMNVSGQKKNCSERADTIMNSLANYEAFFASLPNPNIVLAGIWTPTILDNIASDPTKDGHLFIDLVNQGTGTARLNRGTPPTTANGMMQDAACYHPDPTMQLSMSPFFGQAQYRLSSFIRSFNPKNISEHSICDATATDPMGGYTKALDVIANNILNNFQADCLSGVPQMANGKPECVVGYVDANNPMATPDTLLPVCSAKCCNYFATDPQPKEAQDPNLMPNPHAVAEMAACGSDPDCYCAVQTPTCMKDADCAAGTTPCTLPAPINGVQAPGHCGNCPLSAVAGVWHPPNEPAKTGQVIDFRCAIQVAGP